MQLQIFGNGRHPEAGVTVAFWLDDRYEVAAEVGPDYLVGDTNLFPDAINRPHRICKGLLREGMEDAYALICKPAVRYLNKTDTVKTARSWRLVVYVDKAMKILNHGWVELADEFPDLPVDKAEDAYVKRDFDKELS